MVDAPTLLLLLNYGVIGSLPLLLFRRGGRLNWRWWGTAWPFFAAPLVLVAPEGAAIGALSVGEGCRGLGELLSTTLSAVSLMLIAGAAAAHRHPVALWHQVNDLPSELVSWGPYRRIRHPLYTAFMLALLALVFLRPSLAAAGLCLCGLAALTLTARREERRIASSALSASYAEYMFRTGRFLPKMGFARWRESRRRPGVGLSDLVLRHPLAVIIAWLAAVAATVPAAMQLGQSLTVGAEVEQSQSSAARHILERQLDDPFTHRVLLLVEGLPDARGTDGAAALAKVIAEIRQAPVVKATLSYLDSSDPLLLADGAAIVVVGVRPEDRGDDELLRHLHERSRFAEMRLRARYPGLVLRWTGERLINNEMRRTSIAQAQGAELRAVPATAAVLLATFGATLAAVLPLVSGLIAVVVGLGMIGWAAEVWPLSVSVINVVTMLGLALSVDYALLMVSRYREARAAGMGAEESVRVAANRGGRTILICGSAVAIGLTVLLALPINELRSVAVGGAIATAAAMLAALTLTPVVLSRIAPRLDARCRRRRESRLGKGLSWWSGIVVARPWLIILVASVPLLPLLAALPRLSMEEPGGDWLPRRGEAFETARALAASGRHGLLSALTIVIHTPNGASLGEDGGAAAVERLARLLSADQRIQAVNARPMSPRNGLPGDSAATLEVIPRIEGADALGQLVRDIRGLDAERLAGTAGAGLLVTGMPAFAVDYEETVGSRLPWVIGGVALASFVVLAIAFGSVLVPLKTVLLNLLSVGASTGALVLVFQEGHGAGLLGLDGPTGAIFPFVLPLVFCAVFGLSIDYEIFLVDRVAEGRRAGLSENEALRKAIVATGGVISGAAAVMIAIFAAFVMGEFLLIKMLGFAFATTVLIDATLVRLALGPALLRIAGRWNWWPSPGWRGAP